MHTYPRTIVIPLFGEKSNGALQAASFIAKAYGARLLVVRAGQDVRTNVSHDTPDYQIRRIDLPNRFVINELEDVNYEEYRLTGEPISGLRDFVLKTDGDLAIVDNDLHFDGAALGNTARSLLEALPCSVLLIKSPVEIDACRPRPAGTTDVRNEPVEPFSNWLLNHV